MNSHDRRKLARQKARSGDKENTLSPKTGSFGIPVDGDKVPEYVTAPPPASGRREPTDSTDSADSRRPESPPAECEPTPTISPDEVSNGANLESVEALDSRRPESPPTVPEQSPPTVQKVDKTGRPPIFDDIMKAKVVGLITAGVSQRRPRRIRASAIARLAKPSNATPTSPAKSKRPERRRALSRFCASSKRAARTTKRPFDCCSICAATNTCAKRILPRPKSVPKCEPRRPATPKRKTKPFLRGRRRCSTV